MCDEINNPNEWADNDDLIEQASELYWHHKEKDKAWKIVKEVLERNPVHMEALLLGSDMFLMRRNRVQALRMLKTALNHYPDNGDVIYELGNLYEDLHFLESAVELYNKAIDLSSLEMRHTLSAIIQRETELFADYGFKKDVQQILANLPPEIEDESDTFAYESLQDYVSGREEILYRDHPFKSAWSFVDPADYKNWKNIPDEKKATIMMHAYEAAYEYDLPDYRAEEIPMPFWHDLVEIDNQLWNGEPPELIT